MKKLILLLEIAGFLAVEYAIVVALGLPASEAMGYCRVTSVGCWLAMAAGAFCVIAQLWFVSIIIRYGAMESELTRLREKP